MKIKTCGFAAFFIVIFYTLILVAWNVFVVGGIIWLIVYHGWSVFTLLWLFIIMAKGYNVKITPDELSFTKPTVDKS
jgi:hypothetical protein